METRFLSINGTLKRKQQQAQVTTPALAHVIAVLTELVIAHDHGFRWSTNEIKLFGSVDDSICLIIGQMEQQAGLIKQVLENRKTGNSHEEG